MNSCKPGRAEGRGCGGRPFRFAPGGLVCMFLLLSLTAWTGCSARAEPLSEEKYYIIFNAEPKQPQPIHYRAYQRAVQCADRQDPSFDRISWYSADSLIDRGSGRPQAGLSVSPRNWIYLAEPWARDVRVAQHEVLHLLLPGQEHDDPEFAACDPLDFLYR